MVADGSLFTGFGFVLVDFVGTVDAAVAGSAIIIICLRVGRFVKSSQFHVWYSCSLFQGSRNASYDYCCRIALFIVRLFVDIESSCDHLITNRMFDLSVCALLAIISSTFFLLNGM